MITIENFRVEFDKLCAAFSKSVTDKQTDQWFMEFEQCEKKEFLDTLRRLQRGEKFPTWAMVWATYRPLLTAEKRINNPGCEHCEFGLVFLVDYHQGKEGHDHKVESTVTANCSNCSRDRIGEFFSIDRRKLTKTPEGEYWTQRALAHKRSETEVAK